MKLLVIATGLFLSQNALTYMTSLVLPLVVPAAAAELGVGPAFIGAYMAIINGTGILVAVTAGNFVVRYGGTRICQIGMLISAAGLCISVIGGPVAFAGAAVLLSISLFSSTPSSSQILARLSPPNLTPLVFSIKQTGIPVGSMIAGLLIPLFLLHFGWRGPFLAAAVMCVLVSLALTPFRKLFDTDRQAGQSISVKQSWRNLTNMIATPTLRRLILGGMAFVGLQVTFSSFFVSYLADGLGHSLTSAGFIFAISQSSAIVSRIGWGWIAGRWLAPRMVLGIVGLIMSAGAFAAGFFTPEWSVTALIAVGLVLGATAVGWNGVFLAEIARNAPPGKVGAMIGANGSFLALSSMTMPAMFGILLATTGSYAIGFQVIAAITLVAAIAFMIPDNASGPTDAPSATA
ncbi:MAG: MFS transporter [Alphaproteobacteria bacterium]